MSRRHDPSTLTVLFGYYHKLAVQASRTRMSKLSA